MKIALFTDPMFAGTGFSEEARHIMYRLAQEGHDIFWVGTQLGFPVDIHDSTFPDIPQKGAKIKLLGNFEQYGSRAFERYFNIYNPDILFLLGDPTTIVPYIELKRRLKFPILFYVTLDGLPIPIRFKEIMSGSDINVCMTEWALSEYQKAEIPVHAYVHHGCFKPESLILFKDGKILPIGYVVENKIKGKIYDKDGLTEILDWQKTPLQEPLLNIFLENGSVIGITKDNLILTQRGWIPAGDIKLKYDSIYTYVGELDGNNGLEVDLFGWDNRWRREYINNKIEEKYKKSIETRLYFSSNNKCGKYINRFIDFFRTKISIWKTPKTQRWFYWERKKFQGIYDGFTKNIRYFKQNRTVFSNKKGTMSFSSMVLPKPIIASENIRQSKWYLYGRGIENSRTSKNVEFDKQRFAYLKIVKIVEEKISHVYDLTTSTHEFLANGMVVHNCNWNYWQVSNVEKENIKRKYHLQDTTVFISWDNNQYRKRIDALLRCWRDFNPIAKKAKLLLYTDWNCRIGWDLESLIQQYDVPRETIISPRQLIGRDKLWECAEEPWLIKEIASLGDIYVSTSGGEGFGKCNLEAMAIGMPVIATDCSAITEVLDKYGVLVPTYAGRAGHYQLHDAARSCSLAVVDEEKFTEKMLYYYQNPNERIELGLQAKEWAREFDYDTKVMLGWSKILSGINPDTLMARSLLQL